MRALALFTLGLLLSSPTAGAELQRDVEYGRSGETRLLLDASVPEGKGPFPVAILIHGGGWNSGDKSGSNIPGNGADITPWFGLLKTSLYLLSFVLILLLCSTACRL